MFLRLEELGAPLHDWCAIRISLAYSPAWRLLAEAGPARSRPHRTVAPTPARLKFLKTARTEMGAENNIGKTWRRWVLKHYLNDVQTLRAENIFETCGHEMGADKTYLNDVQKLCPEANISKTWPRDGC